MWIIPAESPSWLSHSLIVKVYMSYFPHEGPGGLQKGIIPVRYQGSLRPSLPVWNEAVLCSALSDVRWQLGLLTSRFFCWLSNSSEAVSFQSPFNHASRIKIEQPGKTTFFEAGREGVISLLFVFCIGFSVCFASFFFLFLFFLSHWARFQAYASHPWPPIWCRWSSILQQPCPLSCRLWL